MLTMSEVSLPSFAD